MRFLIRCAIAAVCMTPALAFAFSDVISTHPYYEAIQWAQGQGIIEGYADGTFHPDAVINRAEFTKIVIGANFTSPAFRSCDPNVMYSYSDAEKETWYSPYLCLASQHEIVKGYADGTFRPEKNINFAEAAKIVALLSTYKNGIQTPDLRLPQDTGGPWYDVYVRHLKNKGVIPPSISAMDQLVTRGEMVFMMHRLKGIFSNIDEWKTYTDTQKIFSIDFPPDWLTSDVNLTSYQPIGPFILPGMHAFASNDPLEPIIQLGYFTDADRLPGEKWSAFTLRYFSVPYIKEIDTDYGMYTEHYLRPDGWDTSYEVLVRGDMAIIMTYHSPSTTTTAIRASLKFLR